jgi:hypothetical protein
MDFHGDEGKVEGKSEQSGRHARELSLLAGISFSGHVRISGSTRSVGFPLSIDLLL